MAAWQMRELRRLVREREGMRCRYCGCRCVERPADREPTRHELDRAPTVDHWVPLARGGSRLSPANVVLACGRCNRDKANLSGDEYLVVVAYRQHKREAVAAPVAA